MKVFVEYKGDPSVGIHGSRFEVELHDWDLSGEERECVRDLTRDYFFNLTGTMDLMVFFEDELHEEA